MGSGRGLFVALEQIYLPNGLEGGPGWSVKRWIHMIIGSHFTSGVFYTFSICMFMGQRVGMGRSGSMNIFETDTEKEN